ncbi:hypothetical protein H4R19_006999, partial [Coemansia spiralis]
MQGHRHSTWREAKAVVAAVDYFLPYIDGAANLRIESDASSVIGQFNHKTRHDYDDLSRFRAELTALGVRPDQLSHRTGESQLTADWASRAKEQLRPRKTPAARTKAVVPPPVVGALTTAGGDNMSALDSDDEESIAMSSDDGDDERFDEPVAPVPPPPLRALQQRPAESRAFIQYRDRQALRGLPDIREFVDAQDDDDTIQAWGALCIRRDDTPEDEPTPEMDDVELMAVHDGILMRAVPSRWPGVQSKWVPVLPLDAMKQFIRAAHMALAHPGYRRTLEYVQEHCWAEALPHTVQQQLSTCATCQLNAIQHHVYTPLVRSATAAPGDHLYVDHAKVGRLVGDDGAADIL